MGLTWGGGEGHDTVVGECAGFEPHAFLPSLHLYLALRRKEGNVRPITRLHLQTRQELLFPWSPASASSQKPWGALGTFPTQRGQMGSPHRCRKTGLEMQRAIWSGLVCLTPHTLLSGSFQILPHDKDGGTLVPAVARPQEMLGVVPRL